MTPLVTIDQVRTHLRIDLDYEEDNYLLFMAGAASEIIVDYLKLSSVPADWDDTASEPTVPSDTIPKLVQAAVLEVVAEMYKNREAGTGDVLSNKVTRLLWRMRDPAAA
jgi:hypothetical protein